MPRDMIIHSFAGGGGAFEETSVRCQSKLDLLAPGEKDHGDLVSPAPYDSTEKEISGVAQPKNNPVVRANTWVNDNESTRASDIAHIAQNRFAFALHPEGTAPHQRIRLCARQLSCSQIDPTSSDRLKFRRFVPDHWKFLERLVERLQSPRCGLIDRRGSRHCAPDLPLFEAAVSAMPASFADVIES
ncbi:hypothetical protein [Methylobacterium frigidaeris]|uniref:hypothetical protein n=1 Tax=Methylobacterium frigidaeris TaxID=2038277 RepID=UPI001EDF1B7C|nr:hypothetical protein [Methylobacterium frigidaeris]